MAMATVALNTAVRKPIALPAGKRRTLVVDDSVTILHAVCTLLQHHNLLEVAGRAESGPEAIDAVIELKPELVLLDADMPGMSGLRTSLLLSQMSPETTVILMSMETSAQFQAA